MKSIEEHIEHDKEVLADPTTSEPMKRHMLEELHELEVYADHHHEGNHKALKRLKSWFYLISDK